MNNSDSVSKVLWVVICLAVFALACEEPAAPEAPASEPPTLQEPPATEQPSETEAPPTPTAGVAAEATEGYQQHLARFGNGETAAYVAGFADPVSCFYGSADAPRSHVQEARADLLSANSDNESPTQVHSIALTVLSETDDTVTFTDYGWTGAGVHDEALVFHRKLVEMKKTDAGWLVSTETSLEEPGCGLDAPSAEVPATWTRLNNWWSELKATCIGPAGSTADDGFVGLGGSNECDPAGGTLHGLSCTDGGEACADFNDELRALGLPVEES